VLHCSGGGNSSTPKGLSKLLRFHAES
jgi:hypothetical protein